MFPTGTYECGFTVGSIRHIARYYLDVVLLPDNINMKFNPLVIDCTIPNSVLLNVSAAIPATNELYTITWYYDNKTMSTETSSKTKFVLFINFLPKLQQLIH